MADIKLGYGIGIKATLLTPAGAVCDLRDALYVNAVLTLPNGSTMYAQDIAVDRVTNAIYVRLLADRELTAEGNYRILFNVKLADGVMYSTVAVNFANVTTDANAEYKELSLSFSLEVTDYPQNVERTGASPKVSTRQTWLVYNDEAKAYEDTGIPAEVNFSDYYTKEETDAKVAELESVENIKQSTTVYAPVTERGRVYFEEHVNSGNIYFKAAFLNVRCNSTTKTYTMSDLAAELGVPLAASVKGVANCIAIPNVSALVYNVSTKEFAILGRDLIRKEHIILIEGSSGQIIDIHQNLLNANDLREISEDLVSGYDAYFATGAKPTFTKSGDSIMIKLPNNELRIYDSKGNATIVDSYLSAQFTIANFQKLALNLHTKEIKIISFSEAVNFPYMTLLSLTGGAVSGLFDKYYQHTELSYINELEQLKNKVELYIETDYRDSVKLEGNTSTGEVFFTYKGNIVVRSSKKNRNILITDLAAELGVSLVTSTKGVENCIAIPNISNLCFNALTGAFEIVHRDSVMQEHIILVAGASGIVIYVHQNLLNAYDVKELCENLSKQLKVSKSFYIGERPNLPMRSEFRDLFSISTSAFVLSTQGMDIYANKYLFQGSNEPSESVNYNNIVVVDMDSKKVIGGLEFKKESHLNTINCGLKFAESDTYPLLYVSECYYEHKCEVVRLANDLASYQVIQKIAYNGSHFEGWSAYDWTIDLGNSYIYAFGTNNGFTQILKFSLPLPTSGDVMLTDSDILDVIEFNGAYVYQGAKVINNQMYIPFGFDTSEYPAFLKVVDIERKMVVSHIPLDGVGEPEAVALYNNNLVIVNHANKPTYTEIIL